MSPVGAVRSALIQEDSPGEEGDYFQVTITDSEFTWEDSYFDVTITDTEFIDE